MAVITISEAAKTWKCGRATIYRKLSSGELSGADLPDGGRGVDTSELHRVFGAVRSTDAEPVTSGQDTGRDLIRENAHLLQLLEAKDEHIESLKQALRLIEHRAVVEPVNVDPVTDQGEDMAAILETERTRSKKLEAALEAERTRSAELAAERGKIVADTAATIEAEHTKATALEAQLAVKRSGGFFSWLFPR